MYVPKYFRMDPETDDLLFDGYDLKRDMIVLIEGNDLRRNVDVELDPEATAVADQYNRWCTVFNNPRTRDGSVEFIALYEDGTKKKMLVAADRAWYVKKVSIPNTTSTRHTDHSDCFQETKKVEEDPAGIKIVDAISHHPEALSINSEYGKQLEDGEVDEA